MTEGESTKRAALRPGLIHRAVGGEVFVLMADSTVHWLKNAPAVALWRALEAAGADGVGVERLVTTLCETFEVVPDRARADVLAFLTDLADKGLVDLVDGAAARGGAD